MDVISRSSCLRMLALVCVFLFSIGNKAYAAPGVLGAVAGTDAEEASVLYRALGEISVLPGFTHLETEFLQNMYPGFTGNIQGVGHANASHRDKVLEILGTTIPSGLKYCENVTEKGKINRLYIEEYPDGKVNMLYVFIGHGGNDLVAVLFSGASLEECKQFTDQFK